MGKADKETQIKHTKLNTPIKHTNYDNDKSNKY